MLSRGSHTRPAQSTRRGGVNDIAIRGNPRRCPAGRRPGAPELQASAALRRAHGSRRIACAESPTMRRMSVACWLRLSGTERPVMDVRRLDRYQGDAHTDRFRYAERSRGSWLRTATGRLIGEDVRPPPGISGPDARRRHDRRHEAAQRQARRMGRTRATTIAPAAAPAARPASVPAENRDPVDDLRQLEPGQHAKRPGRAMGKGAASGRPGRGALDGRG
jgi:hypothetical protein